MKCTFMLLPFVLALAVLPLFATEQFQATTIPFDFAVNGQVYPAGDYELVRTNVTGVWFLRSGDLRHRNVFIVNIEDYPRNAQPKLVFHRYGKHAFLRQIWSRSLAVSLLPSRQEAAIRASVGRPVVVALLVKQ